MRAPRIGTLEGVLGDADVQIDVGIMTFSESRQRKLQVRAVLPFWPPLDARLRIAPVTGWQALRSAGQEGFVHRFSIEGAEPDRVNELVTEQAREALDQSFVMGSEPRVSDWTIEWVASVPEPWPTVEALAAAIRRLPVAWSAIVEASREVRPARGAEEAFVTLAGLTLPPGLELKGCPTSVYGQLGSIRLALSVASGSEKGFPTRVVLRIPRESPGSPRVVREERLTWLPRLVARLSGKPEIEVGDAAFDERFSVRSLRPEQLVEALDGEVRAAMLALDDILPLEMQARSLSAGGLLPAERLGELLRATLALARALEP